MAKVKVRVCRTSPMARAKTRAKAKETKNKGSGWFMKARELVDLLMIDDFVEAKRYAEELANHPSMTVVREGQTKRRRSS